MLHTGLGTKTMYAFENGFFPSVSSPPPAVEPCSHSGLSLTAIVSSTIKCRSKKKKKKKYSSTYHELSHRSHAHTGTHKNAQHTAGEWVLLLISALMCETSHKYWGRATKGVLSFESYDCSATPMTELCLDFRSVKLWTASIFSPISTTFTFL